MSLLRRESRATLESPLVPMTSATLVDWLMGPKSHAGVRVTQKNALGLTAVWRSVALISGSISSLPLHAYRVDNDRRVSAGQRSQGEQLLRKPHPDMTPMEFWEIALVCLLLWGNFYARILRNPLGQIVELWPLLPWEVRAGRAKDGTKVYRISGDTDADGGPRPHTDETVFHIPGMGYDGVTGLSVIKAAQQGLGLAMAAEEFGARLFANGSLASGILQTEQRLTQEQADALKDRWKARVGGLANAHEAVVLDRGAEFKQLTINPDDAQFIESRRFQIAEVARMFGVPPHMLADMERSTSWGTGIEQQAIGFVVWNLRPWITRIEQRITSKLLQADTVYAKFKVEGLLRGDSQARAEFYKAMREVGAMNADDVRALEDLEPIPGGAGAIYHRPANWVPLDAPAPEPTQPAAPAQEEGASA